jgi:hypothetical protein
MFNADTNLYNACLTKYLESKSYNCYLPQRDGLSVAQLSTYLQKHNPEVANEISCYVPYYFDLGCRMIIGKNVISFPQCVEMYSWILGQAYNKTIEEKKGV